MQEAAAREAEHALDATAPSLYSDAVTRRNQARSWAASKATVSTSKAGGKTGPGPAYSLARPAELGGGVMTKVRTFRLKNEHV